MILLTGTRTMNYYPKELRMIEFYDEETKKHLTFLTNNMKLAASTIAAIYKSRWQIEPSRSSNGSSRT
jgi:Transposase DDE domain